MQVAMGDSDANTDPEGRQQPFQFSAREPEAALLHCLFKAYQFRSLNRPLLVVRRPMLRNGATQASARDEARVLLGLAKADRIQAIAVYVRQRVAKCQQKGNDAVAGPGGAGLVT